VAVDALLVEGIRAFKHLVVAFLHWVAFGAGAGLFVFIGG
jgi:enoyl-CoA hydratase/carnithine racemase